MELALTSRSVSTKVRVLGLYLYPVDRVNGLAHLDGMILAFIVLLYRGQLNG